MNKPSLILPALLVLSSGYFLCSCEGKKDSEEKKDVTVKTYSSDEEHLYSVLRKIDSKESAEQSVAVVNSLVGKIGKAHPATDDKTSQELLNVVNEALRLTNEDFYHCEGLRKALKTIQIDSSKYGEDEPLEVDGFEVDTDN